MADGRAVSEPPPVDPPAWTKQAWLPYLHEPEIHDPSPIEIAGGAGLLRRAKAAAMPHAVRAVPAQRKKIALAVAAIADVVQLVWMPVFIEGAASPFEDALDILIAAVLIAVLGIRVRLVLAFATELIPGADLFPTGTAVVASLPTEAPAARETFPGG